MKDDQNQPDQEPQNVSRELSKTDKSKQSNESASDSNRHADPSNASRRDDILTKLAQLAGCVAMGVVPTQRANSMRGIYTTMLNHLGDASTTGSASLPDDELLEWLRDNPKFYKMIEPFLSKEQIDLVMREATDGD